MISNYKKTPQQLKQIQHDSCLLRSINKNSSLTLDSHTSSQPSIESKISTMSTMAADLRAAAVAAATANTKSGVNPPMEAVVVNSIIYSKPSFCCIEVNLGDSDMGVIPTDNKLTNGSSRSSVFNNKAFATSSMGLKQTPSSTNFNTTTCLEGLASSSTLAAADAHVYRMCTTINGAIHHQISDFCDNILAMAGFFGVANNEQDDDSFIQFGYDDDDDHGDDDYDEDDYDEDDDDEEEDYDEDEDDVVDFSYECPIKPAKKINCDKKKKVRFNVKPTVHVMHTWNYAYRAARKGDWEMYARDRERFKMRIHRAAVVINPILDKEHRQKTYEKRFANLLENNHDDQQQNTQHQIMENAKNVDSSTMDAKAASITESQKSHQKKKRKKKRLCKMGNKHYF